MNRTQYFVTLSVEPSRGLVDEKFTVLVQKAPPSFKLTIRAFHKSRDKNSWEAFGHYITDATGTVNVSQDLSLGGTYSGVEQMGLLWSLRPVPGSEHGIRFQPKDVHAPVEVTISVYQGHQTEGFTDQMPLASVPVERWYMTPGVRKIPITEGLAASLFLPSGPGPFPGILVLEGGRGNLFEYHAALLASRGFASMVLHYLKLQTTKETVELVKLDYFEAAYKVLAQHPQVVSSRIAMLGLSLGTSVTVRMAALSKVVKLRCAVGVSGSHVQRVGDTNSLQEMLECYIKEYDKIYTNEKKELIMRNVMLPIPTDTSQKVDVGRLECPLLMIVGEDDCHCPSYESAMDMKEMMERAGNSHLLTVLTYPDAGHLILPPYSPHNSASVFSFYRQPDEEMKTLQNVKWGGETAAHSRAQEDAWRKMLVFLRKNLFSGTNLDVVSLSRL